MKLLKRLKTLFVSIILSLTLVSHVNAQLSVGEAAIVGGIFGIIIGKNSVEPRIYGPVYPNLPGPIYVPSSGGPMYGYDLHGYCAPYRGEQYAYCMGNIQRKLNEQAYLRGLRGY